jgi:CubicO group peptidase (beta-lactamase class C family)
MSVLDKLSDIQAALDATARQHKVPGASLGIFEGDVVVEFATGVTNVKTGVPVTTDTLFQIGSNTKVYTATLVMQLVDEGSVELDEPVRTYVPEFTLANADVADAITVRHILTHTNGIPGDHFEDTGRGDDAIERYVATLAKLEPIHDPGEIFSYSNAAFMLAGYLIEKVTGKLYHQVIKDKLFTPLGLSATTVMPEEMLHRRVASGHMVIPAGMQIPIPLVPVGEPVLIPRGADFRCALPAGSWTGSTPAEVLAFVRMHLDGGLASGKRVLSEEAVKLMQTPHASSPGTTSAGEGARIGLSWVLNDWDGVRVIGHGGGTNDGQLSMLEAIPERRFALCLLTNCSTGPFLWRDLGGYLFKELAGVSIPEMPKPPAEPAPIDLAPYEGKYENAAAFLDVRASAGKLTMTMTPKPGLAAAAPGPFGGPQAMTLVPIDEERFYGTAGIGGGGIVAFVGKTADGRPKFFHGGGRASRRV